MRIVIVISALLAIVMIQAQGDIELEQLNQNNLAEIQELAQFGDGIFTGNANWSPDGNMIAVGGSLGIWLFDAKNLQDAELLPQKGGVRDFAWSSDGTMLTTTNNNATSIWDIASKQVVATYEGAARITYSPNDEYLVLTTEVPFGNTGLDIQPIFKVYDTRSGELITNLEGDGLSIGGSLFSDDGQFLITASSCYLPQYCEINSLFSIRQTQALGTSAVVEFSESNAVAGHSVIAVGGSQIAYIPLSDDSNSIVVLDLQTEEEFDISPTDFSVDSLISYQSELVALATSTQGDQALLYIDIATGEVVKMLDAPNFWSYSFSPSDSTLIATHDRETLHQFKMKNDSLDEVDSYMLALPELPDIDGIADIVTIPSYSCIKLEVAEPESHCGTYSADNRFFAGQDTRGDAYLWTVVTHQGERLLDVEPNDLVGYFTFSTDSTSVFFRVSDCLSNGRCMNSTLHKWDLEANTHVFKIETGVIDQIEIMSPNIVAMVTDGDVVLVNSDIGAIVTSLPSDMSSVVRIAFTPDKKMLITTHADNTIRLWGVSH